MLSINTSKHNKLNILFFGVFVGMGIFSIMKVSENDRMKYLLLIKPWLKNKIYCTGDNWSKDGNNTLKIIKMQDEMLENEFN